MRVGNHAHMAGLESAIRLISEMVMHQLWATVNTMHTVSPFNFCQNILPCGTSVDPDFSILHSWWGGEATVLSCQMNGIRKDT